MKESQAQQDQAFIQKDESCRIAFNNRDLLYVKPPNLCAAVRRFPHRARLRNSGFVFAAQIQP